MLALLITGGFGAHQECQLQTPPTVERVEASRPHRELRLDSRLKMPAFVGRLAYVHTKLVFCTWKSSMENIQLKKPTKKCLSLTKKA